MFSQTVLEPEEKGRSTEPGTDSAGCPQLWKIHSCSKSSRNTLQILRVPVKTCERYEVLSEVEAELLGHFVFQVPFTYKARALIGALHVPQIHSCPLRDRMCEQSKWIQGSAELCSLHALPGSPPLQLPAGDPQPPRPSRCAPGSAAGGDTGQSDRVAEPVGVKRGRTSEGPLVPSPWTCGRGWLRITRRGQPAPRAWGLGKEGGPLVFFH